LATTNGGTGLTSFTSGGAVYATSTSALATGTLPVASGGTGAASLTANNVLLGNGTSALQVVAPGANGNVLTSNGTTWVSTAPAAGGTVTSVAFSAGTTGLTVTGSPITTSGTITLAGTLITSNGGTGLTSYTAGDLVYYATGTALSKLAIGTANRVLTSSGTAPQWSTSLTMAGSVTATALIPSGSSMPTNGMYLPSANNISLVTNSTDRLTINSSGDASLYGTLGISANTPTLYLYTSGPSPDFSIYASSGYLYAACTTSGLLNAAFSDSGNMLLGGTGSRTSTVGSGHFDLFDSTAPVGTLTNGVSLYSSSGDFYFMNSAGNGYKVGYRNIPPVGTQTGSYILATGDVGKYVQVATGGSITIPSGTFAEGDAISIANNTTGNITITCSAPTAYIAGTNTVKTSMTLATRGVATVLFISSTVCFVSGNVT
jgi:hypothetical protein